jgi:WD40 repeat protein
LLASRGRDGVVRIWDVGGHTVVTRIVTPSCHCLAFSPNSKVLVAGCFDLSAPNLLTGLDLWSVDGRLLRQIPIREGTIDALSYSRDGNYIAFIDRIRKYLI